MKIIKNGKVYEITETATQWNVKLTISKVDAVFNIPKEGCETFEDLEKYIAENNLFDSVN